MTVPYISMPHWAVRRPRALAAPAPRAQAAVREHARARGFAFIDVAIQLVGVGLIAWLAWTAVTSGLFTSAVDTFSGWYSAAVGPELAFDGLIVREAPGTGFFTADAPVGVAP